MIVKTPDQQGVELLVFCHEGSQQRQVHVGKCADPWIKWIESTGTAKLLWPRNLLPM